MVTVPDTAVSLVDTARDTSTAVVIPPSQSSQNSSVTGRTNQERKSPPNRIQSAQKRPSMGGIHSRRRHSRLSTDVTSFDLTPNRRGSLGATSGSAGTDGLLARILKHKRPSALSGSGESKKARK